MARIGDHQHVEVLVGLDQRLGHQQRQVRRHVIVQGAVDQHQVALEVAGQGLVGLAVVVALAVLFDQFALVALGPVILVAAVVVVAAFRPGHLEELRIAQDGRGGGIAAAGVAPDAGA